MKRLVNYLLDLFYPPKCIFCDRLIESAQQYACPSCELAYFQLSVQEAMQEGQAFSYCCSAAYYEGAVRDCFLGYKFRGDRQLAPLLAQPLATAITRAYGRDFDCITWLPISPERLRTRGYDQSRLLATEAAQLLSCVPVPLLHVQKEKPPQSSLAGITARRENVRGCFAVLTPEKLVGKTILLIDDVITTGASLEETAGILRAAGAKEVLCATLCRTPPRAIAEEAPAPTPQELPAKPVKI